MRRSRKRLNTSGQKRKIAGPRWWYTAIPKRSQLVLEVAASEHDSTCHLPRLANDTAVQIVLRS